MTIDMQSNPIVCFRCGKQYVKVKGAFWTSYAALHKGAGYIPVCKECVEDMYNTYLSQCGVAKDAVRQMCRKLDLYWSEAIFDNVEKKTPPRSLMQQYIYRLNTTTFAGKSYDDTLVREGALWNFREEEPEEEEVEEPVPQEEPKESTYVASEDVIKFWGSGYTNAMYEELEQRLQYWKGLLSEESKSDVGTEALIRQICAVELDINRDRAAGKSIDKLVTTLNTLLGSLNLKPAQRKDDNEQAYDNTPFGVWIRRFENERPIPEPDPELQDSDGIIRYVLVWFYGHLAKMLGVKNAHSKLYEDEIAKLRVERPEYDEDDDETMLDDIFGSSDSDG